MIGALTVGGFLYSNTIGTLPPASAESQPTQKESRFLDTWRWQNYFLLHHNADFIEELAVGDLKHGDTFDVTIYTGVETPTTKVASPNPYGLTGGILE
ncbi:DUF5065 family protein [Bacillus cereus]|nr:DUF5065 family protein [Bacillus cereus]